MSARFSPAARTRTRTRSAVGLGASATSRISRPSTPPKEVIVTTLMIYRLSELRHIDSSTPVARLSFGVCYGKNRYDVALNIVNQCVRQTMDKILTEVSRENRPFIRMLSYLVEALGNLHQEFLSQVCMRFVICYS